MADEDKNIKPEEPTNRSSDKRIYNVIKDILNTDSEKTTEDIHKQFHKIPSGSYVSHPVRGRALIDEFNEFGVQGEPYSRDIDIRESEMSKRIREFVGDSVTDEEFKILQSKMTVVNDRKITDMNGLSQKDILLKYSKMPENSKLKTIACLKKYNKTERRATKHLLKYRSDKGSLMRSLEWQSAVGNDDMEPGKVVLYTVRLYRPFNGALYGRKNMSYRKTAFPRIVSQQEVIFHGGQTLAELRDIIKCPNDYGPRNDISENPSEEYVENLKEVFPSGFLFINDIFYNDTRYGKTVDYSENIRSWARQRNIADLELRSLEGVTFDSMELRLGHPEVYIHQGTCEHLFTICQVKLLQPTDVCISAYYPHSIYTSVYKCSVCIICGSFTAQWVVTGSPRIPFDPAYLCTQCFNLYNYVDGKKVGEFKAYRVLDKNSAAINSASADVVEVDT